MTVLTIYFQLVLEIIAKTIRKKKLTKGINMGKEERKLSSLADGMILYMENPKASLKRSTMK